MSSRLTSSVPNEDFFFPECFTGIQAAPRRSQAGCWRSLVLCFGMRPVASAVGGVEFSVFGFEVPSELSEPSGTPWCVRRQLGLLLMRVSALGRIVCMTGYWNAYKLGTLMQ